MENLLFLGMLMPFIFTTPKNLEQVTSSLSALDFIRGVGSYVLATIYVLFTKKEKRNLYNRSIPMSIYGLYVLFCLFSTLWSINPSATFQKSFQILGVYWCAHLLLTSQLNSTEIIKSLQTQMMVITFINLMRFILSPLVGVNIVEKAGFGSFIPTIASNLFGTFLGIYLLSVLLITNQTFKIRLLFVLVALILLYATHARIATVVSISICLIAFIFAHSGSRFGKIGRSIVVFMSSLIVFLIVAISSNLLGVITSYFNKYGNGSTNFQTLTGRTFVWRAARVYISESPIVGHGYYAGHRIGLGLNFSQLSSYSNIDNMWLESLVDVGFLGTVLLLFFSIFYYVSLLKNKLPPNYKIFTSLAMVNLLVMSFFNPSFQAACSSQVVALLLCISVSGRSQIKLSRQFGSV